jgi:predicted Rossmann fold flavoprotein
MVFDFAIIGAGASGLVGAINLARRGKKVIILEKNAKVGKKLLATGNGKCNITNKNITTSRYHSSNQNFIDEVLQGYDYYAIKDFFHSIGLEIVEGKDGKIYPMSLQASSVVEMLEYECHALGVDIRCDMQIISVKKEKNSFLLNSEKEKIKSTHLIVATGHLSAPMLGGVEDGVHFARIFHHNIIASYPSLVQLSSNEPYLKKLSGVKIESMVTLNSKNGIKIQKSGDILFTNYGISGLAILDISREVMGELKTKKNVDLILDLMPRWTKEQLISMMKNTLFKESTKSLEIWLLGFVHKKLISIVLEKAHLKNIKTTHLSTKEIDKIASILKNFPFTINGSNGYKGAEVATGGVDTKEINSKTLESKKAKGLYFLGEVLDVDGDRGGFNLHFAWVCGLKVAKI